MKTLLFFRHLTVILFLFYLFSGCQQDQKKFDFKNVSLPQGYNHGKIILNEDGVSLTYFSSGMDDRAEGIILGSGVSYGQLFFENLKKGVQNLGLCLTPYDYQNSRVQVEVIFFKENRKEQVYVSPVIEGNQFQKDSSCDGFLYSIKNINLQGDIRVKIKNISHKKVVIKSVLYDNKRTYLWPSSNKNRNKNTIEEESFSTIERIKKENNGKTIYIKGIVTADFNNLFNYYLYIQDETSGVAVDIRNLKLNEKNIIGKSVVIKGIKSDYYGLPVVKPVLLEPDFANELFEKKYQKIIPKIVSLDGLTHNLKGELVKTHDLKVVIPCDKYGYVTFQSKTGDRILVKEEKGLKYKRGMVVKSIIGVLSFSYGEYRIYPRSTLDIQLDQDKTDQTLSYLWSFPAFYGMKHGDYIELRGTSDRQILYTIDGKDPVKFGKIYNKKISFQAPKTSIRAVSCSDKSCFPEKKIEYYHQNMKVQLLIEDLQKVVASNEFYPHYSIYNDIYVKNIRGYITYIQAGFGFFMQTGVGHNCDVSDGIFVKVKDTTSLGIGDHIVVEGLVAEINFERNKKGGSHYLTQTTLLPLNLKRASLNTKSISPVAIGTEGCRYPIKQFNGDLFSKFNPREDGLDYYKSLQSRLVKIKDPIVIGASDKFKGFFVRENFNKGKIYTDKNGILLSPYYQNSDVFYIKAKSDHRYNVGDVFKGDIQGIMTYNYGIYEIQLTEELPEVISSPNDKSKTSLVKDDNSLIVATYNIENFCRKLNKYRVLKIAREITHSLNSPDIVALQEVMDNDCKSHSDVVSGSENFKALIQAIIDIGGPNYSYEEIHPIKGQEGGIPGGNIRVGFLYNKGIIRLTDKEKGDALTEVSVSDKGLSHNPGRIEPFNPAFKKSRRSLVGEFVYNNQKIYIINNHFKSKHGDTSIFEKRWPLFEFTQEKRREQFKTVTYFAEKILRAVKESAVVILGDMNDFHFSKSLSLSHSSELFITTDFIPKDLKYSYNYRGNSQMLDHIILSNNLWGKFEVDVVHLNSNINYHDRTSDHDPVLVKLNFN